MTTDGNVDHVEIYRDTGDQFRWRALAGNGEIVAEGEAHTTESNAARAARGVFGEDIEIRRESSATDANDDLVDLDVEQTEGVDA